MHSVINSRLLYSPRELELEVSNNIIVIASHVYFAVQCMLYTMHLIFSTIQLKKTTQLNVVNRQQLFRMNNINSNAFQHWLDFAWNDTTMLSVYLVLLPSNDADGEPFTVYSEFLMALYVTKVSAYTLTTCKTMNDEDMNKQKEHQRDF